MFGLLDLRVWDQEEVEPLLLPGHEEDNDDGDAKDENLKGS